jgi:hypothetical protein
MDVNALSDAEKEVFKKQIMPVYNQFKDSIGDELMNAVLEAND